MLMSNLFHFSDLNIKDLFILLAGLYQLMRGLVLSKHVMLKQILAKFVDNIAECHEDNPCP